MLASEAIMGRTHRDYDVYDKWKKGSILQIMRDNFFFGRVTKLDCTEAAGTLPNPVAGCKGAHSVEEVFVQNIFGKYDLKAAWKLSGALMGVHTFGGTNKKVTGADGLWGTKKDQRMFSNSFYTNMMYKGWYPHFADVGNG